MEQQTYVGVNGKSLEYPAMYTSFEQYVNVLRINLKTAQKSPRLAKHVAKIQADLEQAETIDQ